MSSYYTKLVVEIERAFAQMLLRDSHWAAQFEATTIAHRGDCCQQTASTGAT